MKACVSKTFRFEAAHHLPNHDGKCREPHGHSYRVVVKCEGKINVDRGHQKCGMVVDFADIKTFWKRELEPLLDHKDLNVTLEAHVPATTAECIAFFICAQFRVRRFPIKEVEVWETETSCATVDVSEVWLNGGDIHDDPIPAQL